MFTAYSSVFVNSNIGDISSLQPVFLVYMVFLIIKVIDAQLKEIWGEG